MDGQSSSVGPGLPLSPEKSHPSTNSSPKKSPWKLPSDETDLVTPSARVEVIDGIASTTIPEEVLENPQPL